MEDLRQTRELGSCLTLGGVTYRLEEIEGCGASSVVYRATYPDSLNCSALHQVFIKELYPLSRTGGICRDAQGNVLCDENSRGIMELARQRFLMGNQVNLELLQQMPANTAGNLNSYEAYGTYYSVLSVHGGENLLHRLEARGSLPVRESVEILQQILCALEGFHRRGLLHLDISPDNVLLLPHQAMLIDFNSVWDLHASDWSEFAFSRKPGYSPPEVLLQNASDIGPATDLYSCCAVFFHMLSGRRLRDEELAGGGFQRSLSAALPCLEQIPQTAAAKILQILAKGLNTLARRRYPNIAALQQELQELLDRLDGFGVTRSALWEASAALLKKERPCAWGYLDQAVADGGTTVQQEDLLARLMGGQSCLLTGPGGMGKTRFLQQLWKRGTARYRPDAPVFFYLSLKGYQECAGEAFFLRRSLLQALRFSPESPGYQDALHALEQIFDQKRVGGQTGIVLLLDGLNEAGTQREKLLIEMEELSQRSGTAALVTERTDGVLAYGLQGFSSLELMPLHPQQVLEQLHARGLNPPEDQRFLHLLQTPMLLFLYLEAAQIAPGSKSAALPESQEELVTLYLEQFCRRAMRADSGNLGRQLCSRYLLEHLLPEIAWEMRRQKKTLLTLAELCRLTEKSYHSLCGKAFGTAFPEYLGRSRLMFERVRTPSEWFDLAIREELANRFGLLTETREGYFSLLHDNFLEVLAGQAERNHRVFARRSFLALRRRGAALLAALLLAGGLGGMLAIRWHAETNYSAQEKALIYDALASLNGSLGMWSNQISAQKELVDRASISDVLDNQDPRAQEELAQMIQQKRAFLDSLYAAPLDAELARQLSPLTESKGLFAVELLEQLCSRFEQTESVAEAALNHLQQSLCQPDSGYNVRDKRERLVNAYRDYLDAEVRYVSYLLADLLAQMSEAQQQEVLSAMTYMQAFEDFYDGPGSVAPDRLLDGTARALEALKAAQWEMNAEGFAIEW